MKQWKQIQDANTSTDRLISEIEPVVKKRKDSAFDSKMLELKLMDENKTKKAAIILQNFLIPILFLPVKKTLFSILKMNLKEWNWQIFCTIYSNLVKKMDEQKYFKILSELDISAHLVYRTHAKKVLDEFSSEEKDEQPTRKQKKAATTTTKTTKKKIKDKRKMQSQKSMRAKRRQMRTRVEIAGLSIDDVLKLHNIYLKGPASFGNKKNAK